MSMTWETGGVGSNAAVNGGVSNVSGAIKVDGATNVGSVGKIGAPDLTTFGTPVSAGREGFTDFCGKDVFLPFEPYL